jgi:hypothetical protein
MQDTYKIEQSNSGKMDHGLRRLDYRPLTKPRKPLSQKNIINYPLLCLRKYNIGWFGVGLVSEETLTSLGKAPRDHAPLGHVAILRLRIMPLIVARL